MRKSISLLDDKDLVTLFKEGNSEAFGVISTRYSKKIWCQLLHLLKDPTLADDYLQDTLIKAMTAIQNGSYSHTGVLKSWLMFIAHNIAMDHFRKLKRNGIVNIPSSEPTKEDLSLLNPFVENEVSPEDQIISLEVNFDLETLMELLPADQKEVLVLRHYYNMSFKEIAEYIGNGMNINTCLGRMRYALMNIRKLIKEKENQKTFLLTG